MSRLPLIGITACSTQNGLHAYHISGDIYASAQAFVVPGLAASLPSVADRPVPSDILDGREGTPITVTSFNIEPIHTSGADIALSTARNSARLAFVVAGA